MGYAFISYVYRDIKFVDLLVDELHKAGINTWLDAREIKPGSEWGDAIADALKDADAVIAIASVDSIRLGYVQADLKRALFLNKLVIPIVIDENSQRRLPDYLRELQPIDAHDPHRNYPSSDRENPYLPEAALKALIERLPESVQQPKPVRRQAPKSKGYAFISYAEEDSEFVHELRDFLKERGYGYWDYQDSDRNYQTQLFLELEEVIRGAAATLSVLSPDWKKSTWAAKEYLFSEEVGTPVFLLMAREMGPTLVTAGIAYIDFTRSKQSGYDKLDRELRRKGLIE
jgi:hypothetical protein